MKSKRAVILLSGGLDSATVLYFAKAKGYKCFCLIFDYGQKHLREIQAAKDIASVAKCAYQVLKISLPWKGSSLLDKNQKIPLPSVKLSAKGSKQEIPSTYVPGRNIIFLSFALSYAESIDAGAIFIGANALDYSGYPDCRPAFMRAFSKVAACGTKAGSLKSGIKICAPLINKNKSAIIKLGVSLEVPFSLSWSCYRGGKVPCGKCESCFYRAKGFKEARLVDPALLSENRFKMQGRTQPFLGEHGQNASKGWVEGRAG